MQGVVLLHYDLIVIGSGPAGHHAAIQGSKLGKRVAIIERPRNIGGVCFNTGTVPSKAMREAAIHLSGYQLRGVYGASYRGKKDLSMGDLLHRCHHVVQKEVDVYTGHFARNGVDIIFGTGSFKDANTINVQGQDHNTRLRGERIVVACGTVPAQSPSFPVDGKRIIDADGVFDLERIPKSMIVVGGGVIGLEYASIFALLGTRVTVVEGRNRLLEFVDGEIVEALTYHLRDFAVTPRLGEAVERVEADDQGVTAFTRSNKMMRAETVLYAVGRQGATDALNLKAAGLQADKRGRLKVDENLCTAVPHIYAAGDVIGFPSLASTSMEQGRVAASNAFGVKATVMPALFPYGIYTVPEISFVGKTEEQLTEESVPYEVGIARYREIARGNIMGDETGRLKLVFHRETEKLLGVHILGSGATELVHIGQAVMALGGTARYFMDHVFNYPTLAECYKVAAFNGLNKLGMYPKAA